MILFFFSRMDHYALCLSYHSNTDGPICSLLSGLSTTTGRLLGLNMALCVFLNDTRCANASGVKPRFRNLSITSSMLYQLNRATAANDSVDVR